MLIKRVADGDQSALTELYDSTSRLVFGLVLRVVGDRSTAEEVLLTNTTGSNASRSLAHLPTAKDALVARMALLRALASIAPPYFRA